ncbi:hypothetical protein ABZ470_02585 [Streptosporangium sp. NPDC020072]|uniref:hypothetical protein n=1 Tax=Streptosporangium sp. NPDC020072 TaxID=3154788 RepID=UPI00341306C7
MKKKITVGLVVLAGATALIAGPAAGAATTASGTAGSAAACNVQHEPWYTIGGYRHVRLQNECNSKRTVCIAIPYRPAWFPIPRYTLNAYEWRDVAYAPTSINQGNSVYYC